MYNISMTDIYTSLYGFMRAYRAKGDSVALVRGNAKMRFDKLFSEIDKVAAGLVRLGVGRGDCVMLCLPNIFQAVVAVYAVSRIGAVASMIHPKLAPDEFARAVEFQNPKVVFLSDINVFEFSKKCKGIKKVICPFLSYSYLGLPAVFGKPEFEPYDGNGEEAMFYMQSGGTTGASKTIMLSSRAVNAMARNLPVRLDDKFGERNAMLTVMPMFHGFGLCIGVHASLCTNMRAVLMPKFNAKAATKAIAKNGITTVLAVPRMVAKLLAYEGFAGENIKTIEDVYVGGDAVSDELVAEFDKRMSECGSRARLSPGYGLTETVTVCALSHPDFVKGAVGKPIEFVECKVVDDELLELPLGEVGELLVSSEQTMNGYLKDEAATKEVLVEIDGRIWVRTGDLFSMDADGNLYFKGRKKRLIKISGMNVFPSEIERVARELDFVKECVAIQFDIGGKPYIKLLVEGELSEAQKEAVIDRISKKLSHWNTPKRIECVAEFPRTKVGKIDIVRLSYEHSKN